MRKPKSKIQQYLEYISFRIGLITVYLLPLKFAHLIFVMTGRIFFLFDRRHRERVIQHLLHAGIAENQQQARKLAWENFKHFSKVAVEIGKMRSYLNPNCVRKCITVSGSQKARDLFFTPDPETGKAASPAIIITAHYGNWEMAGIGYNLLSGIPLLTVMRPFDNKLIGSWIYRQREGFEHRVCEKERALKPLLQTLREGNSVCIIADQHASKSEGVETEFFGHPARTHSSPAKLHLKTGVPILVAISRRLNDNFEFEFICADPIIYPATADADADIKAVAQLYTSAIEKLVRRDPVQWLWAHRRWLDINRGKHRP